MLLLIRSPMTDSQRRARRAASPVRHKLSLAIALSALGLQTLSSQAQEAESRYGLTLEEVVVTAQKREENLMDVPDRELFKWISGETLPSHKHVANIKKVMKCSDEALYTALLTNFQNHMARILGTGTKQIAKFYAKTASNN